MHTKLRYTTCLLHETYFKNKDVYKLKEKSGKYTYCVKTSQKEAGRTTLTLDKIFRTRNITTGTLNDIEFS